MTNDEMRERITKTPDNYTMPGRETVTVRRDVEYRATDGAALTVDLYYPLGPARGAKTPAVLFVLGYPDPGVQRMLGCKTKEMASYVSWGKLAAASGLVGITYTNREPASDLFAVLDFVRANAASLSIDEQRIGVWSCSGNVPNALSLLAQSGQDLKCAALCYGMMFDLDGSTAVADAAKQWGFAYPGAAKSVDDLPPTLPLFVARAGRDEFPGLNGTIDRFVAQALRRNLPLTFVNHAAGPHAFDIMDNSAASHEIVRRILSFLRFHLLAAELRTTASAESASRTT